jgi:hypothetical protein
VGDLQCRMRHPFFLAVVRFHILVGIICVVAGIAAMLSQKRRGRYSTFGTIYYWCLSVLVVSATGLSLVRWTENYHLFFLGALSTSRRPSRAALRQSWRSRLRVHLASSIPFMRQPGGALTAV